MTAPTCLGIDEAVELYEHSPAIEGRATARLNLGIGRPSQGWVERELLGNGLGNGGDHG
jgi:hypothetical protein